MELKNMRALYNAFNVPYKYYFNGDKKVQNHFNTNERVLACYYTTNETCYFREKVDVYIAVHELAHALHHRIDGDKFQLLETATLEAFADAVSYVVLSKFIDVSEFTTLIQRVNRHSKDIDFLRINYPWFNKKVLTIAQSIVNVLNHG